MVTGSNRRRRDGRAAYWSMFLVESGKGSSMAKRGSGMVRSVSILPPIGGRGNLTAARCRVSCCREALEVCLQVRPHPSIDCANGPRLQHRPACARDHLHRIDCRCCLSAFLGGDGRDYLCVDSAGVQRYLHDGGDGMADLPRGTAGHCSGDHRARGTAGGYCRRDP